MRKKILFTITKARWGGAAKYVYDLATGLPSDRFDAVVLLGGEGELKDKLEEAGIRTVSIPSLQRDISFKKEFQTLKTYRKIFRDERPDIVHINSSKGGLAAFAARLARVDRIIFTAHGWAFTEARPRYEKILFFFLQVLTVFFAHTTITVSETTKQEMTRVLPPIRSRIKVIHNGIEQFHRYTKDEARSKLLEKTRLGGAVKVWHNTTLWIGSIAEPVPNKGIDAALEAISALSPYFHEHNVSLVYFVIGDGDERERLEKRAHKLHLSSTVFFLGHVDEAKRYLNAFDVFLLPSRKEGFPYALLEAGLAKLPVIASRVGGIKEIIEPEETGLLIQPAQGKEIEESILRLARNPELRKKLGKALANHVQTRFSKQAMREKTLELYTAN